MELVTPKLMKIWKDWELRSMVLTSLLVQIILIVFSSRRKYIRREKFRATVWCSYLLADSAATIALGILTSNLGDIYNKKSLFLGRQSVVVKALLGTNSTDSCDWIHLLHGPVVRWPSFIAKHSLVVGSITERRRLFGRQAVINFETRCSLLQTLVRTIPKYNQSRCLVSNIQVLVDLIISFKVKEKNQSLFQKMSDKDAFDVVAIELGFMCDKLYTKETVIYTPGLIRHITTLRVQLVFCLEDMKKYKKADISVTSLLLLVAVVL
ncbi:hypothetical protein V6N13_088202 [Hibiscus sabdariffa]|uniref:DUF4220 domain-containing protein n=1 Tax=Hibiscus sabdariffa TaxID=183260 RepID=A0ABR2FZI5_9ROSI